MLFIRVAPLSCDEFYKDPTRLCLVRSHAQDTADESEHAGSAYDNGRKQRDEYRQQYAQAETERGESIRLLRVSA